MPPPCNGFAVPPLYHGLYDQRHQRQCSQQRRDGERRHEIILIIEDLDVERHGVRLAPDMAGYDRHRAELTHSPRVAEQNAVKQAPADIGQRDMPEGLPAAGRSEEHTSELQSLMRI